MKVKYKSVQMAERFVDLEIGDMFTLSKGANAAVWMKVKEIRAQVSNLNVVALNSGHVGLVHANDLVYKFFGTLVED